MSGPRFLSRFRPGVRRGVVMAGCAAIAFSGIAAETRDLMAILLKPSEVEMPEILAAMKDADGRETKLIMVFPVACRKARAGDFPELTEIFSKCSASPYIQGEIFPALADAWLRFNGPTGMPPPPELSATEVSVPDFPAGYPEELKRAVRWYLQVMAPFEKLKNSVKPTLDYEAHRAEYAKLLSELVAPGKGPFTEKVLAFHWANGCAMGSEQFLKPQAAAIVLALVRDGRWAEAAGALLEARFDKDSQGGHGLFLQLIPDLETVLVGGLAMQRLDETRRWQTYAGALLVQLLLCPGDARVDELIALARNAEPSTLPWHWQALAAFARPESGPAGKSRDVAVGFGKFELPEIRADEVSPEARKRALDFLMAQATPDLSVENAKELAEVLQELSRPETVPGLRRLLEHPSRTVAEKAVAALKEAGVTAEVPPKLGPVRYRILLNGQPVAYQKVDCYVARGAEGTLGSSNTGNDAVLEVGRDYFLDQGKPVTGVSLRSPALPTPADPWFGVVLPTPPAGDEVIPVEVTTKALRVKLALPRPLAQFAGKTMEVMLYGEAKFSEKNVGYWGPAKLTLPVADHIDFTQIMPGNYFFVIRIPGAVTWSGELRAGESPEVSMPLQRGSDVHFTLTGVPDGPVLGWQTPELRQNGKKVSADWDYIQKCFRGVPAGEYVMHLRSSAELRKAYGDRLPKGEEFAAVDVPFSVRADSPTEIHLGKIQLKQGH